MKKQIIIALLAWFGLSNCAEHRLSDEIKKAHSERQDILFMILPPSRDIKVYKPNASPADKQYTPFGLEVKNKTGKSIWVSVANEQINTRKTSYLVEVSSDNPLEPVRFDSIPEKPLKIYRIPAGQSGAFAVDTAYTSAIAFWSEDAASEVLLKRNYDTITKKQIWNFKPTPNLIIQTAESAQGKTVYITLDEVAPGKARPQTGPAMGLSGRTDTGLKLDPKKNVTKEDLLYFVPEEE